MKKLVVNAKVLIDQKYYSNVPKVADSPSLLDKLVSGFTIMGEIKPSSPSEGQIFSTSLLQEKIKHISEHADAISVLTEPNYFGGHLSYIEQVVQYNKPVLMKDIIIDEKQIRAGKNTSAILLIKRILDDHRIKELTVYAHQLGLEVILEVDNRVDFEKCLDHEVDIVAINNRNLDDLSMDRTKAVRLLEEYQPNRKILAFSGYQTSEDILEVARAGASGVLIGTALSKHNQPDLFLEQIRSDLREVV